LTGIGGSTIRRVCDSVPMTWLPGVRFLNGSCQTTNGKYIQRDHKEDGVKNISHISVRIVSLFGLFFVLSTLSCQKQLSEIEWDLFVNDFLDAQFVAHPTFAVDAGRHEFDGKLPDWSTEGLERVISQLQAQRAQALDFQATSLDEKRRFERDYLLAVIDEELFWLETAEWPYKNPIFYSGALDPNVYITREYAPLAQRMRAYINYAKAVPAAVEHVRNNLRIPLPRTYIDVGRNIFAGLASYYENDVPTVFASVEDPQLQEDLRAANAAAIDGMKELTAWFDDQLPNATEEFAIGSEHFLEMLQKTERVDVSLEELKAKGQTDLQRNLDALREACEQYAPGKSISECIAKAQAAKPKGGPVEGARRQLDGLRAFLLEKGLVTIPGTETAEVAESPPHRRWNFAYISIPGPYEKGLPSTYYIAPPDPSWSEEDRNAYIPGQADLLFVSVHEVWPGHFLQFLHAKRSPSKFGQVFVGYAFAEGWAHYSEELMWEAGLKNRDPETHIGQLINALLRNVRYLSTIGLHTEGMTVEESERMFREFAYQDPGNAKQQAARGTFDPAYLNYTMGKLMIRKLRQEWTAERGGRDAWRAFHDRFLSYGGPPIPLVRAAMLGTDAGSLF